MKILCGLLVTVAGLSACATGPDLPLAQTICLDVAQETPQEVAYVRRKAAEFMKDYGFRILEEGDRSCQVQVQYDRFGAFQAETVGRGLFWTSRNGYWSQEGMVTVKSAGATLEQDRQVNLRGYSSKQDLLNDLAWQVVRPVTWHFQSAPSPKKSN